MGELPVEWVFYYCKGFICMLMW